MTHHVTVSGNFSGNIPEPHKRASSIEVATIEKGSALRVLFSISNIALFGGWHSIGLNDVMSHAPTHNQPDVPASRNEIVIENPHVKSHRVIAVSPK